MGYSVVYLVTAMAIVVLSRILDMMDWERKNKKLWVIISRILLVIALFASTKALVDIMYYSRHYVFKE